MCLCRRIKNTITYPTTNLHDGSLIQPPYQFCFGTLKQIASGTIDDEAQDIGLDFVVDMPACRRRQVAQAEADSHYATMVGRAGSSAAAASADTPARSAEGAESRAVAMGSHVARVCGPGCAGRGGGSRLEQKIWPRKQQYDSGCGGGSSTRSCPSVPAVAAGAVAGARTVASMREAGAGAPVTAATGAPAAWQRQ